MEGENEVAPLLLNDSRSLRELRDMTKSQQVTLEASRALMSVSWEDVNYYVPAKKEKLHILKGLTGCVNPGTMLAIIGGSGAGKSTLLDVLARRKTMGEITGKVLYNGVPMADLKNLLLRVTGYVTQEDVLKETLTVRETLMFQAEMRLDPRLFSAEAKEERVNKVLSDLGLSHRADSKIGNEAKRGLSGGEKKRVAIAVQLVTDPGVLFLDEPTR
jgi:ABC-type multidrug transport system ATPase subunit